MNLELLPMATLKAKRGWWTGPRTRRDTFNVRVTIGPWCDVNSAFDLIMSSFGRSIITGSEKYLTIRDDACLSAFKGRTRISEFTERSKALLNSCQVGPRMVPSTSQKLTLEEPRLPRVSKFDYSIDGSHENSKCG